MISFDTFGNNGRLGNQMFQYASLKGIASNRGFDFCVAPNSVFGMYDINVKNSSTNVYNCFRNFNPNQTITNYNQVIEQHFHFDKNLFDNCEDNVDLRGYFQSEKYFCHIKDEIKKDFSFYPEVIQECKKVIDSISDGKEIISLHVRRTDYLNQQGNHPIVSLEYYEKCLSELDSSLPVLIFSDDPFWCKEQELFKDDRFFVSENNDCCYDLCLMTMCNYHIIANSSFSWWGSWLSESKKTFAPKNWFGPNYPNHDTKDLYLDGWEIV